MGQGLAAGWASQHPGAWGQGPMLHRSAADCRRTCRSTQRLRRGRPPHHFHRVPKLLSRPAAEPRRFM